MRWNGQNHRLPNWSATSSYGNVLRSKDFHLKINLPSEDFKKVSTQAPGQDDWESTKTLRCGEFDLILLEEFEGYQLYRTTDHVQSTLVLMGAKKPEDAATVRSFSLLILNGNVRGSNMTISIV